MNGLHAITVTTLFEIKYQYFRQLMLELWYDIQLTYHSVHRNTLSYDCERKSVATNCVIFTRCILLPDCIHHGH